MMAAIRPTTRPSAARQEELDFGIGVKRMLRRDPAAPSPRCAAAAPSTDHRDTDRIGQLDEFVQGPFAIDRDDLDGCQLPVPLRQFAVTHGCRQNERGRYGDARQHVDRIVISKINCSKNEERSVDRNRAETRAWETMRLPHQARIVSSVWPLGKQS